MQLHERVEWGADKAKSNEAKHGIAFELAASALPKPTPAQIARAESVTNIDTSDVPPITQAMIDASRPAAAARRRRIAQEKCERISILMDAAVLAWFRDQGPGYQTRIKDALRTYVQQQTKRGNRPDALLDQAGVLIRQAKTMITR